MMRNIRVPVSGREIEAVTGITSSDRRNYANRGVLKSLDLRTDAKGGRGKTPTFPMLTLFEFALLKSISEITSLTIASQIFEARLQLASNRLLGRKFVEAGGVFSYWRSEVLSFAFDETGKDGLWEFEEPERYQNRVWSCILREIGPPILSIFDEEIKTAKIEAPGLIVPAGRIAFDALIRLSALEPKTTRDK